jgi:putative nucleotidyltransferase with HDIG domain
MAEEELKRSFEQQKIAMEGTVRAIAYTVETRDPYTAGHQRRVTKLACTIGEEMKLSKDQVEGLRMSGELHDIGKIHVPAEILSKPGKISEAEYEIIKTHSQVGHDILRTIEFPWPVAKIVLQHHERINGSGYPSGLKGKDILLEAKILAVADVIEAMATHRPYRPALSIQEALEEISKNKGKLYDSKVADICLKVFKEKKFKFE